MKNTISVLNSGHAGDLIYSLSSAYAAFELYGKPIDFYIGFKQKNGVPGHPSGSFTMNDVTYNYLKPLLEYQPWINSVQKHTNQEIDYNFDWFRDIGLNLTAGDLRMCHNGIYPELNRSLTISPLMTPERNLEYLNDSIIISLSKRYRNNTINYSILEPIANKCLFVGLDDEYTQFNRNYFMGIKRLHVKDALHMAQIISSCKLFIGNQSSSFEIAEQLKVPRLLEVFNQCPNVIPIGGEAYGYYTTENFKYYLTKLGILKNNE
jgi:hypothetical protein